MGMGIGSSIDFQDHRPYVPGDDPRYIDWPAFARSGQYTMKLYREEVSPRVDLVVDVSPSMRITPAKHRRTWELVYFCLESALQTGSSPMCLAVWGAAWIPAPPERLLRHQWSGENDPEDRAEAAPALGPLPLRQGALRVFISDLLFPGSPARLLRSLRRGHGRALVLAPFDPQEEELPPAGNVAFVDCETGQTRKQRITEGLRERYREAYRRHLSGWREEARRCDADLARVSSAGPCAAALRMEAVRAGAVEVVG